jgi:hypothetical protein
MTDHAQEARDHRWHAENYFDRATRALPEGEDPWPAAFTANQSRDAQIHALLAVEARLAQIADLMSPRPSTRGIE